MANIIIDPATKQAMEVNVLAILSEQPEEQVSAFLGEMPIEMLVDLQATLDRIRNSIAQALAEKRRAMTPTTGTQDYDDIGDDKRGEGE
jgi:hypothetical protein